MIAVMFLSAAIAVLFAWFLAGRRIEHRPIAVLLSVGFAADGASEILDRLVLAPLRATHGVDAPWTGVPWLFALLSHALELVWPAALVGAALIVFARHHVWPAFGAWAMAVAALAVFHPIATALATALSTADMLSVAASAILLALWYRRAVFATSAQVALAIIVLTEVAALACSPRLPGWPASQAIHVLLFVVLAVVAAFYAFRRESRATRDELTNIRYELVRQHAAIRGSAEHVHEALALQRSWIKRSAEHLKGAVRHSAKQVQGELMRQRGAIRDAAECCNNTARAVASASLRDEDRRQKDQEAERAAADERQAAWGARDEFEFTRGLGRHPIPSPRDTDPDSMSNPREAPWRR